MNSSNAILKVANLNISFLNRDGTKRIIVENGSFEVNPGEIVLIVGENGSGKSTLFKSILSDFESDSSPFDFLFRLRNKKKSHVKEIRNNREIFFEGKRIEDTKSLDYLRRSVGYSRQEDDYDAFWHRRIWPYVLDYVSYSEKGETLSRKEIEKRAQHVYDALRCDKLSDGNFKRTVLKQASGGERKMASLLAAFSRDESKLFILDEPINNLDAYHARRLNNYLNDIRNNERKPGILIITHCPMFLGVDKVYLLKKGKLESLPLENYKVPNCFGAYDAKTNKYIEEE